MTPQIRRIVSLFVLVSFLSTNLSFPAHAESAKNSLLPSKKFPDQISKIHLPAALGETEDFYQGKSGNVILIQDAHAVPDAQRNIEKIIRYFQKEYGVTRVALEGASGPLDPQIFQSFPDQEALRKTFEEFVEAGEISGVTLAAIFGEKGTVYQGLEDWALYEEGLDDYLAAAREESAPVFKKRQEALRRKKAEIYSAKLLEVDTALEDFEANKGNLIEVMKKLNAVKEPETGSALALLVAEAQKGNDAGIDAEVGKIAAELNKLQNKPAVFNSRYQDFQTSQISPAEFALWISENFPGTAFSLYLSRLTSRQKRLRDIEGTKLFRDFETYGHSVKEALFRNDEERRLDAESRRLYLLQKLRNLELSREDWQEVRQIADKNGAAYRFYENAEKRDEVFAKGLSAPGTTIFISGGFHTEGLTEKLREKEISYVVIRPQIQSVPEAGVYRARMQGNVSWKNYFKVENGKVDLYAAFARGARDKLLAKEPSALKPWRDRIIRGLVEREKIADAGKYTVYLDEVVKDQTLKPEWERKAEAFSDALRKLQAEGKLSEKNVLKLFQPSTMSIPYAVAIGRNELRVEIVYPPAVSVKSEARENTRSEARTSAQPSGTDAQQIAGSFLAENDLSRETFNRELREHLYGSAIPGRNLMTFLAVFGFVQLALFAATLFVTFVFTVQAWPWIVLSGGGILIHLIKVLLADHSRMKKVESAEAQIKDTLRGKYFADPAQELDNLIVRVQKVSMSPVEARQDLERTAERIVAYFKENVPREIRGEKWPEGVTPQDIAEVYAKVVHYLGRIARAGFNDPQIKPVNKIRSYAAFLTALPGFNRAESRAALDLQAGERRDFKPADEVVVIGETESWKIIEGKIIPISGGRELEPLEITAGPFQFYGPVKVRRDGSLITIVAVKAATLEVRYSGAEPDYIPQTVGPEAAAKITQFESFIIYGLQIQSTISGDDLTLAVYSNGRFLKDNSFNLREKRKFVAGRSSTADLYLSPLGVSKTHTWIDVEGENGDYKIFITDAGSTNGTHYQGNPISERTELEPIKPRIRIAEPLLGAVHYTSLAPQQESTVRKPAPAPFPWKSYLQGALIALAAAAIFALIGWIIYQIAHLNSVTSIAPPVQKVARSELRKQREADVSKAVEVLKAVVLGTDQTDSHWNYALLEEINWAADHANEALKRGVQKVLVAGSGLRYFPLLMALLGKEIVFADPSDVAQTDLELFLRRLERYKRKRPGIVLPFNLRFYKETFGGGNLEALLANEKGTFDLVTLIDLIGDYPNGAESWFDQAGRFLKSQAQADSYIMMDLDVKKNSQVLHYLYDAFPKAVQLPRGFHGSYNRSPTNFLYRINGPDFHPEELFEAIKDSSLGAYFDSMKLESVTSVHLFDGVFHKKSGGFTMKLTGSAQLNFSVQYEGTEISQLTIEPVPERDKLPATLSEELFKTVLLYAWQQGFRTAEFSILEDKARSESRKNETPRTAQWFDFLRHPATDNEGAVSSWGKHQAVVERLKKEAGKLTQITVFGKDLSGKPLDETVAGIQSGFSGNRPYYFYLFTENSLTISAIRSEARAVEGGRSPQVTAADMIRLNRARLDETLSLAYPGPDGKGYSPAMILKRLFPEGDAKALRPAELAKELDISKQRVGQLRDSALFRLAYLWNYDLGDEIPLQMRDKKRNREDLGRALYAVFQKNKKISTGNAVHQELTNYRIDQMVDLLWAYIPGMLQDYQSHPEVNPAPAEEKQAFQNAVWDFFERMQEAAFSGGNMLLVSSSKLEQVMKEHFKKTGHLISIAALIKEPSLDVKVITRNILPRLLPLIYRRNLESRMEKDRRFANALAANPVYRPYLNLNGTSSGNRDGFAPAEAVPMSETKSEARSAEVPENEESLRRANEQDLTSGERALLDQIKKEAGEQEELFGHATDLRGLSGILRKKNFGSPDQQILLMAAMIVVPLGLLITAAYASFQTAIALILAAAAIPVFAVAVLGTMQTVARLDKVWNEIKGHAIVVFDRSVRSEEGDPAAPGFWPTVRHHLLGIPYEHHAVYLVPSAGHRQKLVEDLQRDVEEKTLSATEKQAIESRILTYQEAVTTAFWKRFSRSEVRATSKSAAPSDPHYRKDDAFGRFLGNLWAGGPVTPASSERRKLLKTLGPKIQKIVNDVLGRKVEIMIIPVGSTLKGYARAESDIEYNIAVIGGLEPEDHVTDDEAARIFDEINKLIDGAGFKGEGMLSLLTSIDNFSSYAAISGMHEENAGRLGYLFLPAVFGKAEAIERARKNAVKFLDKREKKGRGLWPAVNAFVYTLTRIINETGVEDTLKDREHLKAWLQAQGVALDDSSFETFDRNRWNAMQFPSLPQMAEIYRSEARQEVRKPAVSDATNGRDRSEARSKSEIGKVVKTKKNNKKKPGDLEVDLDKFIEKALKDGSWRDLARPVIYKFIGAYGERYATRKELFTISYLKLRDLADNKRIGLKPGSSEAWVRAIIRNRLRDLVREAVKEAPLDALDVQDGEDYWDRLVDPLSETPEQADDRRALDMVLGMLDPMIAMLTEKEQDVIRMVLDAALKHVEAYDGSVPFSNGPIRNEYTAQGVAKYGNFPVILSRARAHLAQILLAARPDLESRYPGIFDRSEARSNNNKEEVAQTKPLTAYTLNELWANGHVTRKKNTDTRIINAGLADRPFSEVERMSDEELKKVGLGLTVISWIREIAALLKNQDNPQEAEAPASSRVSVRPSFEKETLLQMLQAAERPSYLTQVRFEMLKLMYLDAESSIESIAEKQGKTYSYVGTMQNAARAAIAQYFSVQPKAVLRLLNEIKNEFEIQREKQIASEEENLFSRNYLPGIQKFNAWIAGRQPDRPERLLDFSDEQPVIKRKIAERLGIPPIKEQAGQVHFIYYDNLGYVIEIYEMKGDEGELRHAYLMADTERVLTTADNPPPSLFSTALYAPLFTSSSPNREFTAFAMGLIRKTGHPVDLLRVLKPREITSQNSIHLFYEQSGSIFQDYTKVSIPKAYTETSPIVPAVGSPYKIKSPVFEVYLLDTVANEAYAEYQAEAFRKGWKLEDPARGFPFEAQRTMKLTIPRTGGKFEIKRDYFGLEKKGSGWATPYGTWFFGKATEMPAPVTVQVAYNGYRYYLPVQGLSNVLFMTQQYAGKTMTVRPALYGSLKVIDVFEINGASPVSRFTPTEGYNARKIFEEEFEGLSKSKQGEQEQRSETRLQPQEVEDVTVKVVSAYLLRYVQEYLAKITDEAANPDAGISYVENLFAGQAAATAQSLYTAFKREARLELLDLKDSSALESIIRQKMNFSPGELAELTEKFKGLDLDAEKLEKTLEDNDGVPLLVTELGKRLFSEPILHPLDRYFVALKGSILKLPARFATKRQWALKAEETARRFPRASRNENLGGEHWIGRAHFLDDFLLNDTENGLVAIFERAAEPKTWEMIEEEVRKVVSRTLKGWLFEGGIGEIKLAERWRGQNAFDRPLEDLVEPQDLQALTDVKDALLLDLRDYFRNHLARAEARINWRQWFGIEPAKKSGQPSAEETRASRFILHMTQSLKEKKGSKRTGLKLGIAAEFNYALRNWYEKESAIPLDFWSSMAEVFEGKGAGIYYRNESGRSVLIAHEKNGNFIWDLESDEVGKLLALLESRFQPLPVLADQAAKAAIDVVDAIKKNTEKESVIFISGGSSLLVYKLLQAASRKVPGTSLQIHVLGLETNQKLNDGFASVEKFQEETGLDARELSAKPVFYVDTHWSSGAKRRHLETAFDGFLGLKMNYAVFASPADVQLDNYAGRTRPKIDFIATSDGRIKEVFDKLAARVSEEVKANVRLLTLPLNEANASAFEAALTPSTKVAIDAIVQAIAEQPIRSEARSEAPWKEGVFGTSTDAGSHLFIASLLVRTAEAYEKEGMETEIFYTSPDHYVKLNLNSIIEASLFIGRGAVLKVRVRGPRASEALEDFERIIRKHEQPVHVVLSEPRGIFETRSEARSGAGNIQVENGQAGNLYDLSLNKLWDQGIVVKLKNVDTRIINLGLADRPFRELARMTPADLKAAGLGDKGIARIREVTEILRNLTGETVQIQAKPAAADKPPFNKATLLSILQAEQAPDYTKPLRFQALKLYYLDEQATLQSVADQLGKSYMAAAALQNKGRADLAGYFAVTEKEVLALLDQIKQDFITNLSTQERTREESLFKQNYLPAIQHFHAWVAGRQLDPPSVFLQFSDEQPHIKARIAEVLGIPALEFAFGQVAFAYYDNLGYVVEVYESNGSEGVLEHAYLMADTERTLTTAEYPPSSLFSAKEYSGIFDAPSHNAEFTAFAMGLVRKKGHPLDLLRALQPRVLNKQNGIVIFYREGPLFKDYTMISIPKGYTKEAHIYLAVGAPYKIKAPAFEVYLFDEAVQEAYLAHQAEGLRNGDNLEVPEKRFEFEKQRTIKLTIPRTAGVFEIRREYFGLEVQSSAPTPFGMWFYGNSTSVPAETTVRVESYAGQYYLPIPGMGNSLYLPNAYANKILTVRAAVYGGQKVIEVYEQGADAPFRRYIRNPDDSYRGARKLSNEAFEALPKSEARLAADASKPGERSETARLEAREKGKITLAEALQDGTWLKWVGPVINRFLMTYRGLRWEEDELRSMAFIKLSEAADKERPDQDTIAWARSIVENHFLAEARKLAVRNRSRIRRADWETMLDPLGDTPGEIFDRDELIETVIAIIAKLPQKQREALELVLGVSLKHIDEQHANGRQFSLGPIKSEYRELGKGQFTHFEQEFDQALTNGRAQLLKRLLQARPDLAAMLKKSEARLAADASKPGERSETARLEARVMPETVPITDSRELRKREKRLAVLNKKYGNPRMFADRLQKALFNFEEALVSLDLSVPEGRHGNLPDLIEDLNTPYRRKLVRLIAEAMNKAGNTDGFKRFFETAPATGPLEGLETEEGDSRRLARKVSGRIMTGFNVSGYWEAATDLTLNEKLTLSMRAIESMDDREEWLEFFKDLTNLSSRNRLRVIAALKKADKEIYELIQWYVLNKFPRAQFIYLYHGSRNPGFFEGKKAVFADFAFTSMLAERADGYGEGQLLKMEVPLESVISFGLDGQPNLYHLEDEQSDLEFMIAEGEYRILELHNRQEVRTVGQAAEELLKYFRSEAWFVPADAAFIATHADEFMSVFEARIREQLDQDAAAAQSGFNAITNISELTVLRQELSAGEAKEMSGIDLGNWVATIMGTARANKFIIVRIKVPAEIERKVRDLILLNKASKHDPVKMIPAGDDLLLYNEALPENSQVSDAKVAMSIQSGFTEDQQLVQLNAGEYLNGRRIAAKNMAEVFTAGLMATLLSKETEQILSRSENRLQIRNEAAFGPLAQISGWLASTRMTAVAA